MSKNLADIVRPLVKNGLYENKVATEMLASWLGLQDRASMAGRTTYRSTPSNKRYAVRDAPGPRKEAKADKRAPRQNQKRKSKDA